MLQSSHPCSIVVIRLRGVRGTYFVLVCVVIGLIVSSFWWCHFNYGFGCSIAMSMCYCFVSFFWFCILFTLRVGILNGSVSWHFGRINILPTESTQDRTIPLEKRKIIKLYMVTDLQTDHPEWWLRRGHQWVALHCMGPTWCNSSPSSSSFTYLIFYSCHHHHHKSLIHPPPPTHPHWLTHSQCAHLPSCPRVPPPLFFSLLIKGIGR